MSKSNPKSKKVHFLAFLIGCCALLETYFTKGTYIFHQSKNCISITKIVHGSSRGVSYLSGPIWLQNFLLTLLSTYAGSCNLWVLCSYFLICLGSSKGRLDETRSNIIFRWAGSAFLCPFSAVSCTLCFFVFYCDDYS